MQRVRRGDYRLFFYPLLLLAFFLGLMLVTVLYMSKCNKYENTLSYYLNISRSFHTRCSYLPISKEMLVRLMNALSTGFLLCMLYLSLSLSPLAAKVRKKALWITTGILGLQLFFYDPLTYTALYTGALGIVPDAAGFRGFYQSVHVITGILNGVLLVAGIAVLIYSYLWERTRHRSKRITQLFIMVSYTFMGALYENLFFDLPFNALRISRFANNYAEYLTPNIGNYNLFVFLSPYLAVLIIAWLIVLIFIHTRITQKLKIRESQFLGASRTAEFSSRIFTHFIKNQIMAIDAEIAMLYAMPNDYQTHLDNVSGYLSKMKARIDELASRMSGIRLQIEPYNLTEVLLRVIGQLPDCGVRIDFSSVGANAVVLPCDGAMMREVFQNILTNAIEALQTAHVEMGTIQVTLTRLPNVVLIQFADNGPGISANDPDQVFTPFFSSKRSSTNWGVGLSFCRRIVEAHGGSISARNGLHGGAVFEIELPVPRAD